MVQYLFCTIVSKMDKDRFNTVGSVSAVVLTKLHNYKEKKLTSLNGALHFQ